MTQLSAAFKRFEDRLSEIAHLRKIAEKYTHLPVIISESDQAAHTNALVRAGTVLLSSHIQGFVEDLSDLVVDRLIRDEIAGIKIPDSLRFHATKAAIREIREATDAAKTIEKMRRYRADYGEILEQNGPISIKFASSGYKDGFGNPTTSEIKKFFGRFGIDDFNKRMAGKLKSDWPIVENAVNQIVDRRNKIAHGDSLATLTIGELVDYMKLTRKYASATDRVVTSHFRLKGCRFWQSGAE